MVKTKKVLAFLITVCLFLSLAIPAYSADTLTITQKASALNKMEILKGSGSNLNLGGQLKRSDAVTFIVRIMGKEGYVTENKNKLKYTGFLDVPTGAWYAPYIGFCKSQKIIDGYPDGKFYPDNLLSEKAFLKLLLGALGYTYGTDFTWDNLYREAFDVGLVTDQRYRYATEDNNEYTRGNVADILYNALTLSKKDASTTVIDDLLKDGAVEKENARAAGFIEDEIITAVEKVTVLGETSIVVKLNENVKTIVNNSVKIYETDNPSNKLTASVESQQDQEVVIKTSVQKGKKGYTVEIANVEDFEDNVIELIGETFEGYFNPEVKSDFFRISKVVPVSKSVVNVFFTQPISSNIELPSNFEVLKDGSSFIKGSFQNMSVKTLRSSNNAVSIYLKDKTFTDGATYTIKVSGDTLSVYGVKLNDGTGESIDFTGNGIDNEDFSVVSVSPYDDKTLLVEFSQEADWSSALQSGNYSITYSFNSVNIPVAINKIAFSRDDGARGKVVRIGTFMSFTKDKSYQVIIKNVTNIHKQITIPETKYPFSGQVPQRGDLALVNVTATDVCTLAVYVDRPLDPNSAIDISNYRVNGVTDSGYNTLPTKVYYSPDTDPYMVKIFLPTGQELRESKTYKLKIVSGVMDEIGITSSLDAERTFSGTSENNVKPIMYEAIIIAKDAIRVRTSKEVQLPVSNDFKLEYKDGNNTVAKNCSSVCMVDGTTFVLKFDSLDFAKSYTLKINDGRTLKDYSGLNARVAGDDLSRISVAIGN